MTPARDISRLIEIMAALRDKDHGCPWDVEQTLATIAPYTIEEAYEVAEAIADGDMAELRDELGDLLLQVVYHARMAEEAGSFAFPDVVEAITRKLIRRHTHVFGDAAARSAGAAKGQWERIKAEEKAERGVVLKGALDGVPVALPALMRAAKILDKAARVGFEWPDTATVVAKLREEVSEVEAELTATPASRDRLEDEIGDVLFVAANLARQVDVDPEQALRRAIAKFGGRFARIEAALAAEGRKPEDATLAEMEALWQAAKA